MHEQVTLVRPDERAAESRGMSSSLPADLLGQAAGRLRSLALLYAFIFFMAGIFPALLFREDRALLFSTFWYGGTSVVAILLALVVAWVVGSGRFALGTVMAIGLAFEVLGSYGIAIAEFTTGVDVASSGRVMGHSWVAVWTVLFTVVVPSTPRRAALAALASVSAVPVVIGVMIATGATDFRPSPMHFFFWLVFPYLLVVGMAYVGARVVYGLGRAVKAARELGAYQLEAKLGQGGMGEVWRAKHRMLARPAAIKLMRRPVAGHEGNGDDEAVRRFEREAQATARLRSPHTVELFDFGIADDGAFYYVMELLDGLDADSLVRRFGPVPAERAVHVLRQICHSLSEAESCGLVHRDIKPANIFLCRLGEDYDFVKVLDFGIVKASREAAEEMPVHTQEHAIHGTPAFMAPEQALGTAVDGRADIYATACVAYWLLTGQYVFTSDSSMGLLLQHAQAEPPAPSTRTHQGVPEALDRLIVSCLSKNPAARPQTARELSARLAEIEVGGEWTQEQAREWWKAANVATH